MESITTVERIDQQKTMLKNVYAIIQVSLPLAKAGFLLRNEGSYLGILWYLLNPILLFTLLTTLFSRSLGSEIDNYPVYLLLGIILFNFFHITTNEATRIIHTNGNTIKSINFPLEALPGGVLLMTLGSHICEIILYLCFSLYYTVPITITGIILYPFLLLFFALFCFGITLFLSALTIYFVDLENVWVFFLRLLWFGTPLFYQLEENTPLFLVNACNPLYYFIRAARDILIESVIPPSWVIYGIIIATAVSLCTGSFVFQKLKYKFAELI
jgi:ABC-type polysaccharide/polyol phosphate export permease